MKAFVKKHRRSLLLFLLVLCVQMIIFSFSMRDGETSSAQSGAVVDIVGPAVEKVLPIFGVEPTRDNVVIFVRKCGHFLEFALLGMVFFFAVASLCKKKTTAMVWAMGLAFLTACGDEYIQSFSPGRASQFTDVLIDSAGALTGILFAFLCTLFFCKKSRKRRKRKATEGRS